MNSINDSTTARVSRRALHACAKLALGIAAVSGALGCASANGLRQPGFASVDLGASPARTAPAPLAGTHEGALHLAYLAPADRTLDARSQGDLHAIAVAEGAALVRAHELAGASSFAVIGLLASLQASDARGPASSWGARAEGTDDVSEVVRVFGVTIDDPLGSGGLRVRGRDQGARVRSSR